MGISMKQVAQGCLIFLNIIFLISGIAVLSVGIWVIIDKNLVNMKHLVEIDSSDKAFDTAAYILIVFGAIVLFVSILGFVAACKDKKPVISVYIFFVVLIFFGEVTGGSLAAVFKGKIDKELPDIMQRSLNNYTPGNSLLAKAWDYIQVLLECCGSNGGPKDYIHVNFTYQPIPMHVPWSCCVLEHKDPEKLVPDDKRRCQDDAAIFQQNGTVTEKFVYTKGCYDNFASFIKSHVGVVIGIGVGIGMTQIFVIIAACIRCCKVKSKSNDNGNSYRHDDYMYNY